MLVVGIAVLGIWVHGNVVEFWERVKQAFAVLSPPTTYLHGRALAGGDWALRLATIWFLLDAFDIPQSLHNAMLVQVSSPPRRCSRSRRVASGRSRRSSSTC